MMKEALSLKLQRFGWVFILVFFLVIGFNDWRVQLDSAHWPSVEGKIEAGYMPFSFNLQRFLYVYTVDDIEYRSSHVTYTAPYWRHLTRMFKCYQSGQNIRVYYDPRSNKSVLESGFNFLDALIWIFVIAGVGCLVFNPTALNVRKKNDY